jgi:SAM-dependent methyltransferase
VEQERGRKTVDTLNRATWSRPEVVRTYARIDGWNGEGGERAIFARVADQAREQPILDLGVGAGRTVPTMLAISHDYVGLDYTLEMVAAARSRFPGVRLEHGDARDLGAFEDASFGFVHFSFNGIDAVSHADREHVLQEVRRVLRPGGAFGYSTHNLDHPRAGIAPWSRRRWSLHPRRLARQALDTPKAIQGYRRNAPLTERGDGWAMLVSPAHAYGIVIHYVSLAGALAELRTAGFADDVEVYDMNGRALEPGADTREVPWLHLLARVPMTA